MYNVFRVAKVSPSDPVHVAAKRMRELRVNSVVIMAGNKIQGILTYYFFFSASLFWDFYFKYFFYRHILGAQQHVYFVAILVF